ncbi:hypothetical protein Mapa_007606 [Marchantia paleacea]|nr:hypothetical protein Mapa_007606 [Marchantia paleacea]
MFCYSTIFAFAFYFRCHGHYNSSRKSKRKLVFWSLLGIDCELWSVDTAPNSNRDFKVHSKFTISERDGEGDRFAVRTQKLETVPSKPGSYGGITIMTIDQYISGIYVKYQNFSGQFEDPQDRS